MARRTQSEKIKHKKFLKEGQVNRPADERKSPNDPAVIKAKGQNPDVTKGTQIKQPGGVFEEAKKPAKEGEEGFVGPVKPEEKPPEKFSIKEGGFRHGTIAERTERGIESGESADPLTRLGAGVAGVAGGTLAIGAGAPLAAVAAVGHPVLTGAGALWLATKVSEKNDLAVWAAVDNIGQKSTVAARDAMWNYNHGEVDQATTIKQLEQIHDTVTYAEGFVKLSVKLNPSNWFGQGQPFLVSAKENTRTIEQYLDEVKGGV